MTEESSGGGAGRMVVAISGVSGLIGTALGRRLRESGHEVRPLVRRPARGPDEISWQPDRGEIAAGALGGVDVVVNLAGENLAQRWREDVKRRIRESRVRATSLLARTIAEMPVPPKAMLSGSAIGIYGNRGDEILDESSSLGADFLSSVCRDWESATAPASDAGVRVVHLRTGIVLAKEGGALAKMLPPFRLGLGGQIGNGRQWMSWISLADIVSAIERLIVHRAVVGAVNLTAPNPVTNEEFTRALSNELHRPSLIPVPKFALKFALGEMADDTVLASQRVLPRRLEESGFTFATPRLDAALASIL